MRARTGNGIGFEVSIAVDKLRDRYDETYSRARNHDAKRPGWAAFVNDFDPVDVVFVDPADLPPVLR